MSESRQAAASFANAAYPDDLEETSAWIQDPAASNYLRERRGAHRNDRYFLDCVLHPSRVFKCSGCRAFYRVFETPLADYAGWVWKLEEHTDRGQKIGEHLFCGRCIEQAVTNAMSRAA